MTHSFHDTEKWSKIFEDEKRDEYQKPQELFKALGISESATIADIGAGTGYFPVRFAKIVPKGHVFAIDIQPNMVKYLQERVEKEGISNITCLLGNTQSPEIPQKVDIIFSSTVYHHIEQRPDYFRRLKDKLNTNGRVVIVDWKKGDFPIGPPDSGKVSQQQIIDEMKGGGYSLVEEVDLQIPYHYNLIFVPSS